MSTWEERMAAKAAARRQLATDADQIRWAEENAAQLQTEVAAEAADHAAGPPEGCLVCAVWERDPIPVTTVGRRESWSWYHLYVDTDDHLCHHHCHAGEPVWSGPVAYG